MTYIEATPDRVYEVLTTAKGWDGWFTDGTDIDARPGGSIQLRWTEFGAERLTTESGGPVLEAVPNERFSFQWTPGRSPTTVTFSLEAQGSGTLVEVRDSGYRDNPTDLQTCLYCAAGWGEALTLMKFYIEHDLSYGSVPPP